jgi:hypothetical protein
MYAVNCGSGAAATRRASKIDTSSCGRLQSGFSPSRSCVVAPGQATTPALAAVKTAMRRDEKMLSAAVARARAACQTFPAKLSDFRRMCVGIGKILLQMTF